MIQIFQRLATVKKICKGTWGEHFMFAVDIAFKNLIVKVEVPN